MRGSRRLLVATLAATALSASVEQVPPGRTFRPVVRGTHGVVAAGSPLAVEAGLRLLRSGGNAVDAGVAATFAAAVTEFSHFALGGEGSFIYSMQETRDVIVVNADGTAPALATPAFFLDPANQDGLTGIPATGVLSATVPAVVDGLLLALETHGTRSFSDVIAPAVEYADGFPMYEMLARVITDREDAIRSLPGAAPVFLPSGRPPRPGEIFRQPDLARTLRGMMAAEDAAKAGGRVAAIEAVRDYFYRGPVAEAIGAFSEKHGGLLRAADLAAYRARLEKPFSVRYRGWDVYKVGFWSQGPVMLQTLNLIEPFDIAGMGPGSADAIHVVTEAMKLAFADRDRWYGDPDFVDVPSEGLLSKDYATRRSRLIDLRHASRAIRPGTPAGAGGGERAARGVTPPPAPPDRTPLGTTCINIVDAEGNLFSATPSGAWLPSVVVTGTGIPLSERMQAFTLAEGSPNRLAPGKRPRYTLTPTLAGPAGGPPTMAFSTPGLDVQDQTLLQVFLDVAEFGMSLQEAVEAPRFDTLHLEESWDQHRIRPNQLRVEARVGADVIEELRRRGHEVEVLGDWAHASAPTIVSIDRATGVRAGAADPRRDRYVFAW